MFSRLLSLCRHACILAVDEYRHPVQQSVEEYMFSASDDSIVALWSLSKRRVVKDFRHHQHGVNAIEVVFFRDQGVSSSCGSSFPLLISASDDNTVQVVDISSGTVLRTLLGAQDIVFCVAHTYGYVGGQVSLIVFTGSKDKVVRVYNAEEGTCLRSLAEHSGIIRGIRCLGDGTKKKTKAASGFY
jgi:WD40 repeat protein